MAIAVFGKKKFTVSRDKVYTPDDIKGGASLKTELVDKSGYKPRTKILGPELGTFSLGFLVSKELGVNPRKEMESWTAIVESGEPENLIIGDKPYGKYKWLAKVLNFDIREANDSGDIISAYLSVTFEEYTGKSTETASKKKNGKGTVASLKLSKPSKLFTTEDVAKKKRKK